MNHWFHPLWPSVRGNILVEIWRHFKIRKTWFSWIITRDIWKWYTRLQRHQKVIVEKMKNIFARWGIPERITSDNGPQFSSEMFKVFANTYEIVLTPSSPGFPQSNGLAESGVQIAKKILHGPEPSLALMVYRATPVASMGVQPFRTLARPSNSNINKA